MRSNPKRLSLVSKKPIFQYSTFTGCPRKNIHNCGKAFSFGPGKA